MNRIAFQLDLAVIPVAVLALLVMAAGPWAFMSIPGVIAWEIAEYCIHRWGFHWLTPVGHTAHHRDQLALIGANPAISAGIAVLLVGAAWVWPPMAWTGLGLLAAYFWYFVLHSGLNHGVLIPSRLAAHQRHHREWGYNFGVSSSIFDRLFGTYRDGR